MKLPVIILILLFIISCDNDYNHKFLICNNKFKYWDQLDTSKNNKEYMKGGYCFYNTGSYKLFDYIDNKKHKTWTDDIIVDYNWKYLNDSSMIIGGIKVKIVKLTKDTLFFFWRKKLVKLIKSANQTDEIFPEFNYNYRKHIHWDTISH